MIIYLGSHTQGSDLTAVSGDDDDTNACAVETDTHGKL